MRMRQTISIMMILVLGAIRTAAAQGAKQSETNSAASAFTDEFKGHLGPGWYWLREDKDAWRVSDRGLEVLIEPGNMWGPQNDAKNVLLRPAPAPNRSGVQLEVT